jgi:hypothetical protein
MQQYIQEDFKINREYLLVLLTRLVCVCILKMNK